MFPPELHDEDRLPSGLKKVDFSTKHPLFNDLCPQDSYTEDGVYWVSHFKLWRQHRVSAAVDGCCEHADRRATPTPSKIFQSALADTPRPICRSRSASDGSTTRRPRSASASSLSSGRCSRGTRCRRCARTSAATS